MGRYKVRFGGIAAIAVLAGFTVYTGARAAEPIAPGETIDFSDPNVGRVIPDDIDGKAEFVLANASVGITPKVLPLSSASRSLRGLGRANTTIFQYNDVVVDPGSGDETIITAQISGVVNIRGFLALVGWGVADASVGMQVIDLGTAANPLEEVVASHPIAKYQIDPSFSISMGTSLGGIIGTATAGAGKADVSLGLGVPMSKRLIRDTNAFGFTVLVRRGHTYRLVLTSSTAVKIGPSGGRGIASFWAPIAGTPPWAIGDETILTVPPSLVDPQVWLNGLDLAPLDKNLPNFSFPDRGIFAWDWFDDYNDTNDVLDQFDIPTDVRGIVNRFFDRVVPDEAVTQPGVDLRKMQIMLATDEVELLNMISEQVEELKEILLRHPPHQRPPQGQPFSSAPVEVPLSSTLQ